MNVSRSAAPGRLCPGLSVLLLTLLFAALAACAPARAWAQQDYRLYDGITACVDNPEGKDFTVRLDVRDLNLFANGPREILFKVYDPDGKPVVREVIPDDGVTSPNFPDRIGGWDHEIQYYADLQAKGALPSFRWSAWSDPARLRSLVARTLERTIKGAGKGVYRIVLAGTSDHYVTLSLEPQLKYGLTGHSTFLHGHGDLFKKSYLYVPQGTTGVFFAAIEPDLPRSRVFKLTAPDGKVLFDAAAPGGYISMIEKTNWSGASILFATPGQYDGQLLTMEVSDGPGDYLVKVTFQQPKAGAFKEYVGMGANAVFAADPPLAMALKAATTVVDDQVFWHPFQVRFQQWLKAHPLDANDQEKALRKELEYNFDRMRLLEASDGRGSASWSNWAYAMGYYGCDIFRSGWLLMANPAVPADVKAIIKEGLIMAGDRLSFATGIEKVNGNAFAQINVALWYCHQATGDALQKERFEVFFERWQHEGWGAGAGLSRSGDAQEHFSHDMHYGSYIMDNWAGGQTWLLHNFLEESKSEPRFAQIIERYRELYSYLYCREQSGVSVAANPWSSRTLASATSDARNWEVAGHPWKGMPGPDLTVSVNGGNEWFAARRPGYYVLTFHGRLAPQWMSQCFPGQLGFGGGILCQLTVPGKGPVIASTLAASYGEGMHPSNWMNIHVHSIVGETWDGRPLISGISEHDNARLEGNTVTSSGEVRGAHVKVSRTYTFHPDGVECSAALAESDYARVLSIWSHDRLWSELKSAYEMIPFMMDNKGKPLATVTLIDAAGKDLGAAGNAIVQAKSIRIDRGGYGVDLVLAEPRGVKLGGNNTVLIELIPAGDKPVPADQAKIQYRIVPFGAK